MAKTALLVMDVQPGIVDRLPDPEGYLAHVSKAAEAARAASIPVIYVVARFRAQYVDASAANPMTARVRELGGLFVEGHPTAEVHAAAGRRDGDITVVKNRVSAFAGTDLATVLRSLGASEVVLAGIKTSGVVLSTVRAAADLDYTITVLEDLCLDTEQDVQDVMMKKVFPAQGRVVKTEEWVTEIQQG